MSLTNNHKIFDLQIININGEKIDNLQFSSKKSFSFSKWNFSLVNHFYNTNKKKFFDNKKTKTRGEVSASTKKIYKQKGTGGARHGSLKAPQFRGGGVAFGPNNINKHYLKINKKLKKKMFVSAILWKIENKKLFLFDDFGFNFIEWKTKDANSFLINFFKFRENFRKIISSKLNCNILIIFSNKIENENYILRCFRNIEKVNLVSSNELNSRDLLLSDYVLLSKNCFSDFFQKNDDILFIK